MSRKTLENYFTDWESYTFGFGYGSGEEYTIPALKTFFATVGYEDSARGYKYKLLEATLGGLPMWLLINTLCHADIIEYGTSPRYGWLTQQGEALKDFTDSHTTAQLIDLTSVTEDYAHCYPDSCNCESWQPGNNPCNNPFFRTRKNV